MAKILVIDDDKIIRERLEKLLNLEGYQVFIAEGGRRGLDIFRKEKPDIVLLDLKMPGMDGIEVLKEIKKGPKKSTGAEVIMITGHGAVESAIEALKIGAFEYIQKPIEFDELEIQIKKALEKQQMQRKIDEQGLEAVKDMIVTYNHEMNQPLTAIQGYLDFLKDKLKKDEENYKILKTMQEQISRMVKTLNRIKSLDKIETKQYIHGKMMLDLKLGNTQLARKEMISKDTPRVELIKKLEQADEALMIMQAHLIQAGKMTTLGQLSAGIAHELKQPLTGIMGFAEEALDEVESHSPIVETLNIINREAERMLKITDGIRKFSRMSGFEKELVDINPIINDCLLLLTKQLSNHNIKFETVLEKNLPKVYANISGMQQVFVNMISNARDAMESKGSGKLTVKSKLAKNGEYIEISFKDTGCGMPKEVINRLSEPFFTTKGPDKGTGLGTSISFSIIKEHNGDIDITSKIARGTTIKIMLPVTQNSQLQESHLFE